MSEQRTEKPTPQRLRKAREKGQFPAAKEFVSAAQFLAVAALIGFWMPEWWEGSKRGMASMLRAAFRPDWTAPDLLAWIQQSLLAAFLPLGAAAGVLLALTILLQLGATNMGVSLARLSPDLSKLNPMSRLRDIGKQNLPAAGQALVLLLLVGWTVYTIGRDELPALMALPMASVQSGVTVAANAADRVLWRGTMLLLTIGLIELARQRWMYHRSLSMTKQEIRDEHKEAEGDPQIKGQIRRMRRDLLRRRMMQDVPSANAVIVNPTHFAIAIRYEPSSMASPKVVAKGRNLIAARIKAIALEHDVPVVENPPLARALYKAVEVGREIPPDFFRAVAEVLAYVYRMTGRRPQG
jgi:flagellar biosynthesis protein FlhB